MIYRHGDVDIIQISELPKNLTKLNTDVLAEGETTGHSHKLDGRFTIYQEPQTELKFMFVEAPTKIKHEEHTTIEIAPGIYKILIEREFSPFDSDIKKVSD